MDTGRTVDDGTSSLTSGLENIQDTISTISTVVDQSHGAVYPEEINTEEDALRVYEDYDTRHQYQPDLPITKYRQDVSHHYLLN